MDDPVSEGHLINKRKDQMELFKSRGGSCATLLGEEEREV